MMSLSRVIHQKPRQAVTRTRERIHDARRKDGVADEIGTLVKRLLPAKAYQIAA